LEQTGGKPFYEAEKEVALQNMAGATESLKNAQNRLQEEACFKTPNERRSDLVSYQNETRKYNETKT
jgi:hypothetical protein